MSHMKELVATLAKCPFCGSKAQMKPSGVRCHKCGGAMLRERRSLESIHAMWNRRAGSCGTEANSAQHAK